MLIRPATPDDQDSLRRLYLAAFPEAERETVAELAVSLLTTTPETLSLVAEQKGDNGEAGVVGHVALSPVTEAGQPDAVGYLLAPLAVWPDQQKRGVGSRLVEEGVERLRAEGAPLLLVYGDPNYYGRFGFTADAADRYRPPYPLQYPFGWQALALRDRPTPETPLDLGCVAPLCDPRLW
ncbi:hypothetical protein Mal64_15510 [Pseudobythopirellula maris]|uniref:N-acetyltransferase domain-containing protein n=1 Tax=Pseudobythopirellula maris TaxID=2527991 RepID=A0A5C5ZUD9_9BACT|nr:N-acetyltransferase [Pseudobythopirellula maris]TWT91152.1 hypothetical protein Mal64_15510 [Pseudobythopirellula maris]